MGDGIEDSSIRAMEELRDDLVPAAFGGVAGVETDVTGPAAQTVDFNDNMKSRLPYVFGFVLTAAFLLLLVTFRSIVIPIKAILLNLLSVGAAYGVLVLVFQNEWAEGLLNFESSDAIMPWLPLFLFVVLFGLSMDYHVFILTRVREAYDRGMNDGAGRRIGDQEDGGRGHKRRGGDGRGVRDLRHAHAARLQADGSGPGGRRAARRDDHPRRPAAGVHEACSATGTGTCRSWLEWLPQVSPEPEVGEPLPGLTSEPEREREPAPV